MGLYDSIFVKHDCPKCGKICDEYQTKDLGNILENYSLGDHVPGEQIDFDFEIHDICSCGYNFTGNGVVEDGILSKIIEFREGIGSVKIAEFL